MRQETSLQMNSPLSCWSWGSRASGPFFHYLFKRFKLSVNYHPVLVVANCYNMIMFRVTFSKNADKALRRMLRNNAVLLANKIKELASDPKKMRNIKKLTNHPGYRLRVGNWRVVYTVNDDELLIHVITIKTRGEVYK